MNKAPQLRIKFSHRGETNFVFVKEEDLSFSLIVKEFQKEYDDFQLTDYKLLWKDAEGDWITITETNDAWKYLKEVVEQGHKRIHIKTRITDAVFLNSSPETSSQNQTCVSSLISKHSRVTYSLSELKSYLVELEIVTNIVIVTKPTPELVKHTKLVAIWLLNKYENLTVYVGDTFKKNPAFNYKTLSSENPTTINRLKFWSQQNFPECVDLAVTLGGDGTVLYTSLLFQGKVPPILSFHLGSLGFLTVFNFGQFQETLTHIIDGNAVHANLRMRIKCTVYKRISNNLFADESVQLNKPVTSTCGLCLNDPDSDIENSCALTKCGVHHVLNELVVDRGANPNMVMLELFVDNIHLTTILADGLVIATATGSTAYSLSAGGSLIHPEMCAILVTQICPHTLTCRPMVIPGYKELRICVPSQARSTVWASFDGHHRVELNRGDSITITASDCPLPSICKDDQSKDWFNGLRRVLNWNERVPQKIFRSDSWDFE
ncbi:hypothetical protein K7432_007436 [Basidiobolus ranarum]|uniref:PB1 domain-containing protein n=1 Tax=Basidiobolus ranarum TaxID=34480 RepID=A0ABR2WTB9_9FUNG